MGGGSHTLTAALIAKAVFAACASYGDDPVVVLTTTRNTGKRALTAAASALQRVGGWRMADICSALKIGETTIYPARKARLGGFMAAELAAARALAADMAMPEPGELPAVRLAAPPITVQAEVASPPAGVNAPVAPERAAPVSRRPRPHRVAKPAERPSRAVRVKPVTSRTLRYASRFLRARWDLEEVAWLFDVDPADLQRRFRLAGLA